MHPAAAVTVVVAMKGNKCHQITHARRASITSAVELFSLKDFVLDGDPVPLP